MGGLKPKPAHLSTAQEHKGRGWDGYSHHSRCAQPTDRADLPSQYRQVLVNRSFRKTGCLDTGFKIFYSNIYLNMYLYFETGKGHEMEKQGRQGQEAESSLRIQEAGGTNNKPG